MPKPIIEVKNLSKKYQIREKIPYYSLRDTLVNLIYNSKALFKNSSDKNSFWALKDVSFKVQPGEVLGIIGRNGAGKSTLLKILSQITPPTKGEIILRGRVASLLEVGTGFHPELTGRENIYLNGAILGMSRVEVKKKFDEIVNFAGIKDFLDTPLKHFSSGMYTRLAFAIASHLEPEILIIDEILAVGDANFQQRSLNKIKNVSKTGKTILLVSHNMNIIEQLCTSCIHLEYGEIKKYSKKVKNVISNYLDNSLIKSKKLQWKNNKHDPKRPWFTPLSFSVTNSKGTVQTKKIVTNDTDLWVQIEGFVEQPNPNLTIGYALYNENGLILYWSYFTDSLKKKMSNLQKGKVIMQSKLPKKLLNIGNYRIEMIGGLNFQEWLFEPGVNAPSINISIEGKLSDSPFWLAKRPGILAPVLDWQIIQ